MNELVKFFSSYNIINCVLTGVIFIYFFRNVIPVNIELHDNIIENLFIYYFFGSIFSRLGSIVVEPACKKLKIIKYEPYEKFLHAEKHDPKINTLTEINNFYRTNIAIFLFIILLRPLYWFVWCREMWPASETLFYLFALMLCILFTLSFRKQTESIVKRINAVEGGI